MRNIILRIDGSTFIFRTFKLDYISDNAHILNLVIMLYKDERKGL